MAKKLRFRGVRGPAKGAQLSERDSMQLKHPLGPQTPSQYRAETRKCPVGGGGGGAEGAMPSPGCPSQPPFGQTWPRASFLARLRGGERGAVLRGRPGIQAGSPRSGARERELLQHGTGAAYPGALLRCAVPLFLVRLRGDSGSPPGRGLEGKGRRRAGRRGRGLVKFLPLPDAV